MQFRMFHILIFKSYIVPVILFGCKIWFLSSREECKLRVCESRMVRGIFDVGGDRNRWMQKIL